MSPTELLDKLTEFPDHIACLILAGLLLVGVFGFAYFVWALVWTVVHG